MQTAQLRVGPADGVALQIVHAGRKDGDLHEKAAASGEPVAWGHYTLKEPACTACLIMGTATLSSPTGQEVMPVQLSGSQVMTLTQHPPGRTSWGVRRQTAALCPARGPSTAASHHERMQPCLLPRDIDPDTRAAEQLRCPLPTLTPALADHTQPQKPRTCKGMLTSAPPSNCGTLTRVAPHQT